jgi:ABC-type phosphate/phosphonate transport system substrate-binding protein
MSKHMKLMACSTACSTVLLAATFLGAQDPEVVHVGIAGSFVKGLSPGKQQLLEPEFESLVQDFTGLKSKVFKGGDHLEMVKKLETGEWHITICAGIEFAWAQAKNPKVQPFMIAVNKPREIHAVLAAKKDSPYKGFEDLKGKDVHLFEGKPHCRLFAAKHGGDALKLAPITSAEAALDNVLTGKVQAAVVDNIALESYKSIHPGRYARLKPLLQSERFPPTTIAIWQGRLSDRVLKLFRDGMLKANNSEQGREAMANFRLVAFEPVPPDFSSELANIVKAYPPPEK